MKKMTMQSDGSPHTWPTGNAILQSQFLRKLSTHLAQDPAVPLLGVRPSGWKFCTHTKTCSWMFLTALFIIFNNWKQSKCPSVGEWVNELWYIPLEYYSISSKKEWTVDTHDNLDEFSKVLSEVTETISKILCTVYDSPDTGKNKTKQNNSSDRDKSLISRCERLVETMLSFPTQVHEPL